MLFKWFPWRLALRRVARALGFIDPILVMEKYGGFSQPARIAAPVELLRAGAVFHARGLINTGAIQHNLDWIWPYWVQQQFDPATPSFIPRAFSLTHINLTHRNWTAVGIPGLEGMPVVDPRGLVMPTFDSWSVDCWLLLEDGRRIFPSRHPDTEQRQENDGNLRVVTTSRDKGVELTTTVDSVVENGRQACRIAVAADTDVAGKLSVAIRPANAEGISLIEEIERLDAAPGWRINGDSELRLDGEPDYYVFSDYSRGDVGGRLLDAGSGETAVECKVGMASAAAVYGVEPGRTLNVTATTGLDGGRPEGAEISGSAEHLWQDSLAEAAPCDLPDERYQRLYDTALRTLVLCTPKDAYAGPFTYKRFWFRDAVFIAGALCAAGLTGRARRLIDRFPDRQKRGGYFESQEGEWDSNGQVLWAMKRYVDYSGDTDVAGWEDAIRRGAKWIRRNRLAREPGSLNSGLLPAGFSAEHFGPNDHYYWDDFWSVAGLRGASEMLGMLGREEDARDFNAEADDMMSCIEDSLRLVERRTGSRAMPSSPHRSLDSSAVGNMAPGYPLQLWAADDDRLAATADYLYEHDRSRGGFFHEISHSGINAYLTLHIAQVMMRAGDDRFEGLVEAICELASPTGHWPEAIHPNTGGGCMGDGQHAWAASEWVIMMRNMFIQEEPKSNRLDLCRGIPSGWCEGNRSFSFGPAPTPYGPLRVQVDCAGGEPEVNWTADWRGEPPMIEIRLPGFQPYTVAAGETSVRLKEVQAK